MADPRRKIVFRDCPDLQMGSLVAYSYIKKRFAAREPGREFLAREYDVVNPEGEIVIFRVWHTQTQINVRQLKG